MDDKLYKQRRNLFIKREKFEARLIRYLERLITALEVKYNSLPKHLDYSFTATEDPDGPMKYLYSTLSTELFKNMKTLSGEELKLYNNILDDLHHELDEYEEEFKKTCKTGYFTNH